MSAEPPADAPGPAATPSPAAPATPGAKAKSAALLEKERKKAEKAARRANTKPIAAPPPPAQKQQQQQKQAKKGQKEQQQRGPVVQTIRLGDSTGQQPLHVAAVAAGAVTEPDEAEKDAGLVGLLRGLEIEQNEKKKGAYGTEIGYAHPDVHPAILTLGLQISKYVIAGSMARCLAFLLAIRRVVEDYKCPPDSTLSRHLPGAYLSHQIDFLLSARPMTTAMGNTIRWLKTTISKVSPDMIEDHAKSLLVRQINDFIAEKIVLADQVITKTTSTDYVSDGDIILTYGKSQIVEKALLDAHAKGKRFRVIVTDNRPLLEGKNLLTALLKAGVEADYIHLYALDYMLVEVDKVFLGAAAVLADGALYSRAGTAAVATAARDRGLQVMVLCETIKFSDRINIDGIVDSELGDPDALVNVSFSHTFPQDGPLKGWKDNVHTSVVNFRYDVTPADCVSLVITEHGVVLPAGASGVLRASGLDAAA